MLQLVNKNHSLYKPCHLVHILSLQTLLFLFSLYKLFVYIGFITIFFFVQFGFMSECKIDKLLIISFIITIIKLLLLPFTYSEVLHYIQNEMMRQKFQIFCILHLNKTLLNEPKDQTIFIQVN